MRDNHGLLRVLSFPLGVVSLSMIVPMAWALADGSPDGRAFLQSMAAGMVLSLGLLFWGKKPSGDLSIKGSFLLVALAWMGASVIGALPYYFSGALPNFGNALFESVSGFTTTGASVMGGLGNLPRGILFWRSLTQWLGSMGIVVLTLAVLPLLGVGGMELLKAEVPGPLQEKIAPRVRQTAFYLWGVHLFLTAAAAALFISGGMTLFEGLTWAFSSVSTGGFSALDGAGGPLGSPYIQGVVLLFMFLSGMSYVLRFRLLRGEVRSLGRSEEFRLYSAVVVLSGLALSASLMAGGVGRPAAEALRAGFFQAVSVISTTGFVTEDFSLWPSFAQILIFFLMFTGPCAGSAGGGLKMIRLLVLGKLAGAKLKVMLHPGAEIPVRIDGRILTPGVKASVTAFLILYCVLFAAGVLALTVLGLDLESALSGTASALGNVGPALGRVAAKGYGALPGAAKGVLAFLMLAGRLELYAMILFFLPETWRR